MYSLKHRFMLYIAMIFLIIAAIFGTTMDAFADLTESGPSSATATPVTLNGSDQTTTYTLPLSVTNTGSTNGNGWNLTITSTTFTAGTHMLSTTASTAQTAPTVSTCSGNGCPTNNVHYPLTVPANTTFPTAVKLFNAAAGTGKGTLTITPTITIAIPANTFVGTYTSTVNVAIVSGP